VLRTFSREVKVVHVVILTANKSQFLSFFVYRRQTRDRFRMCNNYRPITTGPTVLYGHVVEMVRCDWPFTVEYIISAFIIGIVTLTTYRDNSWFK